MSLSSPLRSSGLRRARVLGVLATCALAVATLMTAAPTADAVTATIHSRPAVRGLYGATDPTYDGVYRQGLALLALHAAGAPTQREAVWWLLRQQCADGHWASFRGLLTTGCRPAKADSNATAMAVMALDALGRRGPARLGTQWLVQHQLNNGGWEYSPGWHADTNSTALVIQALLASGRHPAFITSKGNSGFTFLRSKQLGCTTSDPTQRGALGYQDTTAANDYATVQAVQALARQHLPVAPVSSGQWHKRPRINCGTGSLGLSPVQAGATYLAGELSRHHGSIPNTFGPGVDYGSTANAVLALVGAKVAPLQVRAAMRTLTMHVRAYVAKNHQTVVAAAAIVALAEHATAGHPRAVNGVNLIQRIQRSITP